MEKKHYMGALLQFCASNGYRALRKGNDFFVQDMTSGRVYRAEFQTFSMSLMP